MGSTDYPGQDSTQRERLEWARLSRGLTKNALAKAVNVDPARVTAWTRTTGAVVPKADTIAQLASVLGVDAGWLATGYGSPSAEGDGTQLLALVSDLMSQHAALRERVGSMALVVFELTIAVTASGAVQEEDVERLRSAAASLASAVGGPHPESPRLHAGGGPEAAGSAAARAGTRAARAGRPRTESTPETSRPSQPARRA